MSSTVNIAQETIIEVLNNTGATITNGSAVRAVGSVGGTTSVVLSLADTRVNAGVLGVATHDILDTEKGYITIWGEIGDLDTSSFTEGDLLYVSATVPGELTNIEQQILKPVGLVLVSDATAGKIISAQRNIVDVTAIGQIGGLPASTQGCTTTPTPLEVYNNTPFEQNVTVNQTGASPYTAEMIPASIGASGFYEVSFSMSCSSLTNEVFNFEVYVNSVATGVLGIIDMTNNNMDSGSTSFVAITSQIIDNTEDLEIYVYTDGGNATITVSSCVFNVKRIGSS